jgi:ribosomal RNA assembly protein
MSETEQKKMVKDGVTYILVESTKKSKYRKAKWVPENYDQIDKWKFPEITEQDVKGAFTEESSFVVMFPRYREKYIKECWSIVLKSLKESGIKVIILNTH